MSKQIGIFERIFKNLRISLHAPRQPVKLVGTDHLGNKYYEKDTIPGTGLRPSRWVEPLDPDQFRVPEVPTEWNSWLNRRRADPPSQEEIDMNYAIMMRTIERAKQLEEKAKLESTTSDLPSPDYTAKVNPESQKTRFPTYKEYEIVPGLSQEEKPK
ncbi:NADH dehydrogenase [ubiquinone] 1 alpha subcomplex assembly factor 2-like [Gigantopelta aegis]|uniref:NADH dehydrogenase [ubiquinone] 1 alpha subcomplex assembly factor 2-like n=1 Tax=Gigantopelta aegis TaxID=1735272 RepID=UPI001B88D558|nr:NADH dehydrogenase [ubiquinone] 1 alpha subcomplex assembly factor 2-like [Gigantopelta aegis]